MSFFYKGCSAAQREPASSGVLLKLGCASVGLKQGLRTGLVVPQLGSQQGPNIDLGALGSETVEGKTPMHSERVVLNG